MPRKRSVDEAASVLSSTSTDNSSFSSTTTYASEPAVCRRHRHLQAGWMYWKRDRECWMKVFVSLRKQFLWLTRTAGPASLASPLIQIAVADVDKTSTRGFRITGACDEIMELYLYGDDPEQAERWLQALQDAAIATQADLQHLNAAAERPPRPLRRIFSSRRPDPALAYRGTLVVYHEECKGSKWKRFWDSLRFRQSFRKRLEDAIDRVNEATSECRR